VRSGPFSPAGWASAGMATTDSSRADVKIPLNDFINPLPNTLFFAREIAAGEKKRQRCPQEQNGRRDV
jgi:hypothetical protein